MSTCVFPVYIPVMWTRHSCDEDPPLRERNNCKSFYKIKGTL
jgi:hypothetical protein